MVASERVRRHIDAGLRAVARLPEPASRGHCSTGWVGSCRVLEALVKEQVRVHSADDLVTERLDAHP
jgi:hypothetical protein